MQLPPPELRDLLLQAFGLSFVDPLCPVAHPRTLTASGIGLASAAATAAANTIDHPVQIIHAHAHSHA